MRNETIKLLENGFNSPNVKLSIHQFDGITKFLPNDYKNFLNCYNGGNGNIGDNSYLHLWACDDIEEFNIDYGVSEFLTDIILIGSDGGDIAYGINSKNQFIEVPFIGMDDEEVKVIADNFDDFIIYLSKE